MAQKRTEVRVVPEPGAAPRERNPLLPGIPITLDDRNLTLPAADIETLDRHIAAVGEAEDKLSEAASAKRTGQVVGLNAKVLALYVAIIHGALVRNYPDLTLDAVRGSITPREVKRAFRELLRLSGFVEVEPGEGKRPESSSAVSTGA